MDGAHVGTCRMKEDEMKVWWCAEHDVLSRHSETNCWWAGTWEPKPCRMVPMRLVPADALVEIPFRIRTVNGDVEVLFGLVNLAQASQVGESGR